MPAAVDSAFVVAFWFADKARNQNDLLQPQKLQRLMFLAQAYYAVLCPNRALMPAVFVADELGPIEPNVYAAFAKGRRPDIDIDSVVPETVEAVLEGVWRRYGHHTADFLTRLTRNTEAYREAYRRGNRAEIERAAMRKSFVAAAGEVVGRSASRVMWTQSGRPVSVTTWAPDKRPID